MTNHIGGLGSPAYPANAIPAGEPEGDTQVGPQTTADGFANQSIAMAKALHELAVSYAGKGQTASTTGGAKQTGINNASGAPNLDALPENLSADDMVALLQNIRSKTQDIQLRTAAKGLEFSRIKQEKSNESALAQIKDWIKKSESAAAKQKILGIFGWIAKVFAFVATAIATVAAAVATGGAATPLLAVAVVALVGSAFSLASNISQAAGGPPLELSSLMTKACSAILKGLGVPEEKLDAAAKVMAGSLAVLACPVAVAVDPALMGNLAGGISGLSTDNATTTAIVTGVFTMVATIGIGIATAVLTGGSSALKDASKLADSMGTAGKLLQKLATTGQTVLAAGQGVTSAASGGLGIAIAVDEHKADQALVDKKKFDAIVIALQKQMDDDREDFKKLIEEIQNGATVVMKMINSAGDSRTQIAKNIGQSMA